MLPIGSFSMAAMTFVGQNYGANKMKRAKQGVFITSIISLIYIGIVSMLLFFGGKNFALPFYSFFSSHFPFHAYKIQQIIPVNHVIG